MNDETGIQSVGGWKGRSHGVLLDYVITCVQLQYIGIKEKGDVSYEKRGRQEYAERVTNNFLSFFFSLESDDRYKMGPNQSPSVC